MSEQSEEKSIRTRNSKDDFDREPVAKAVVYLDHLLTDGKNECDSGLPMELPAWYDADIFHRGQAYMSKYRFLLMSGMLLGLITVLALPEALQVLIFTRQSSTAATAYRRYVRTMWHVCAWYDYSPSDRNSKFWLSLRKVRGAHTRVNGLVMSHNVGSITQMDMALTQFGFIGFVVLEAERIQLQDPDFQKCTVHMWRVLGYLLGIKDEYNMCAEDWPTTKQRFEIVRQQVFAPALIKATNEDYRQMTQAIVDGLSPLLPLINWRTICFGIKRMAYVEGCEYYDCDYVHGNGSGRGEQFKALSQWDRAVVSLALFLMNNMHKYLIIRWLLNFFVWLSWWMLYLLPIVPWWRYGRKWAYVRIFTSKDIEQAEDKIN